MLSVDKPGTLQRVGGIQLGEPFVTKAGHQMTVSELAYLHNHPEHPERKVIPGFCSQGCGAQFDVMSYFANVTACTDCRDKWEEANAIEKNKEYWESKCDPQYRNTRRDHEDFPVAQFELLKEWRGERSLIFFGPTGSGKTRLAFYIMKRALHLGKKTIGVMYDEDLSEAKADRERKKAVEKWACFDVLLLDDALLNGAQDEHTTAFLKSLLDNIMRKEKAVILTTQITMTEYTAQLSKYNTDKRQTTAADSERSGALIRRIKEMCGEPIQFYGKPGATPPPANAGPAPDLF